MLYYNRIMTYCIKSFFVSCFLLYSILFYSTGYCYFSYGFLLHFFPFCTIKFECIFSFIDFFVLFKVVRYTPGGHYNCHLDSEEIYQVMDKCCHLGEFFGPVDSQCQLCRYFRYYNFSHSQIVQKSIRFQA